MDGASFAFSMTPSIYVGKLTAFHEDWSLIIREGLWTDRIRRMSASEFDEHRLTETLRDVGNPNGRGAALWAAQTFMATCHIAASDRPSGAATQDRQAALLSRSPVRPAPSLIGTVAGLLATRYPPSALDRGTRIGVNLGAQRRLDINC
jgi:hypothetical protein